MFCQLEALRKCLNPFDLEEALQSLPKTLNETYDRILLSIDERYKDDALKVLQFLIRSAQPMTLVELAEVLRIDVDGHRFYPRKQLWDPRDLLVICSDLVVTSTSKRLSIISHEMEDIGDF